TEEDFFDGSIDHLRRVREVAPLPLLRKDFIFDEYQIYEAAHAGADAVLLIAAMLDGPRLNDLLKVAYSLGLDALVEIHDREEMEMALCYDVRLLGINNRNLRTFVTMLDTSLRLARTAKRNHVGQRERHPHERRYRAFAGRRIPRISNRRGVDESGG